VLFIAPGVIVFLAFYVAAPAQVVESHGVFAALGRSRDLTRGHRGAILLIVLIYVVVFSLLQTLALAVMGLVGLIAPQWVVGAELLVLSPIAQTLSALVGAAGVASVYYELRTVKEGIGAEALAAAFA
jgi:hypothetical protein